MWMFILWMSTLLACIYAQGVVAAIGLGCLLAALFLPKEKGKTEDTITPVAGISNMRLLNDVMLAAITRAAMTHGIGRKEE